MYLYIIYTVYILPLYNNGSMDINGYGYPGYPQHLHPSGDGTLNKQNGSPLVNVYWLVVSPIVGMMIQSDFHIFQGG